MLLLANVERSQGHSYHGNTLTAGRSNGTGDRILNGLFPEVEVQALVGYRFSLPWDIWYGSDILEEAQLVMEPHPVAKSFSISGAGLEEGLQIATPQYMDEGDD